MKKIKLVNSSGGVAQILLVILAVITIAVVVFVFVSDNSKKSKEEETKEEKKQEEEVKKDEQKEQKKNPKQITIGDIKFQLVKAVDRGNVLKAPMIEHNGQYISRGENFITTEKFVQVTISARNIGTTDIAGSWNIGEIIDSEGRVFNPSDKANAWLPDKNNCRSILKPGFTPSKCTKIYEVAKISKDMKVRVMGVLVAPKSTEQPVEQDSTVSVQPQQEPYIYIGL